MENLLSVSESYRVSTFNYSSGVTTVKPKFLAEKSSSYNRHNNSSDVQDSIDNAPPEVRRIIQRVLQAEKDKIYLKTPRNINDDILKIIKEEVL